MNHDGFKKDSELGATLFAWWASLDKDRGARAELRRAHSVTAVVLSAAYQRLHRRLVSNGWPKDANREQQDRLAAAVGLLAHITENDTRSVPQCMSGHGLPEAQGAVSELRFRRLLETSDIDALFTSMRRVIPLMNYRTNVLDLAHSVVHWGDSVKKRWAYDFVWPEQR